VTGAHIIPPDVVRGQIIACLSDIGADAIKTGMLGSADMVRMVADTLAQHAPDIPLVVDPVMVAKGGSRLIDEEAVQTMKGRLLPMAALVTPNLPEAQTLTGIAVDDAAGVSAALSAFAAMGCPHVLLKGGHGDGPVVEDILGDGETLLRLTAPRQDTPHTHGTGCTMATAVACGLAQGMALGDAVRRAHTYVQQAIQAAPGLGHGHGPLGHQR